MFATGGHFVSQRGVEQFSVHGRRMRACRLKVNRGVRHVDVNGLLFRTVSLSIFAAREPVEEDDDPEEHDHAERRDEICQGHRLSVSVT